MRGVRDGETEGRGQDIVMRYKYKVRELKDTNDKDIADVGEEKEMEAMSFKKLQRKLDPKKEYLVMYTNKKNNYISTIIKGRNNG